MPGDGSVEWVGGCVGWPGSRCQTTVTVRREPCVCSTRKEEAKKQRASDAQPTGAMLKEERLDDLTAAAARRASRPRAAPSSRPPIAAFAALLALLAAG